MSDVSSLIEVNEDNFEAEVLASGIPVVVEFGAKWCGPCQKQLPVLQSYAAEHPEVKVAKIDIDECRGLATKYAIRSVPTIMLFVAGNKTKSNSGLMTQEKLKTFIEDT